MGYGKGKTPKTIQLTHPDVSALSAQLAQTVKKVNGVSPDVNGNVNVSGGEGGILSFQTLSELQTAYPSGLQQPVWVVSENSWYHWDLNEPNVIFYDNFQRQDFSSGLGGLWGRYTNNVMGILLGKAYNTSSGDARYAVYTGESDNITIEVVLGVNPDSTKLVFRLNPLTSGCFSLNATSTGVTLFKFLDGSPTSTTINASAVGKPNEGDTLRVSLTGETINCYLNDILAITHTDTFNKTCMHHGIGAYTTTARITEFRVKTLI